ncbi:hypothetical protein IF2G_07709 [Cordyceps javanica]|nr:hypothetical protein IF2G_07709 [Cordyceps javanica]
MDGVGDGSTPDKRHEEMRVMRMGFLDSTNDDKENWEGHNLDAQRGAKNEVPNTMRGTAARDEYACTHTTITTGSIRLNANPLEGCNPLIETKPEQPIAFYPERRLNGSSKGEDTEAAILNDITCPVPRNIPKDVRPYALKTTRVPNRLQLRQKKVDTEIQSTEPKLSPTSHSRSQEGVKGAPKTILKLTHAEDRKKKKKKKAATSADAVLNKQKQAERSYCERCSERLQVGLYGHLRSFPTHLVEDDAIATHTADAYAAQATQTADLSAIFDCTLRPLVAAVEMYCKIVRPVFDPYSSLWERNAKKQTTVLDAVVLVLALPGAMVVIALVVWGLHILTAVGSCLQSAGRAVAGNVFLLFGW